ncbi:MAG TPA: zinc ABC transporter substrate-binding protein [Candidatus Dormibacteraeota bacterium]|nr:zinc ABC transporter substrate-binding protein [Candidatus Dormibacteraeota bacterium]
MKKQIIKKALLISIVILAAGLSFYQLTKVNRQKTSNQVSKIQIVAGENFWGSLVSQIGGNKVNVTTIVSDPNADPHEYETNSIDARAIANANYVILNGAGYDSWGNKLLSGSPNNTRRVLIVAKLLNKVNGNNPHFWYDPTYVNQVILKMESDLINLRPNDKSYFQNQYKQLQISLNVYQNQITNIKKHYTGVTVATTENIFNYLANATGLNLVSPSTFTQAVAEGNDPPTSSIIEFRNQLTHGQVKLLVYNQQTVTPLTDSIKQLAIKQQIPIVGITEIIQPTGTRFQDWMNRQVTSIKNALAVGAVPNGN